MGRRKRKQPTYRRVKRLPKIFTCPECGEKSVKVKDLKEAAFATVKCGNCGLSKQVLVNSISEPVDAFGDFIDVFYADQELQRLEKRVRKLKRENEYGELAFAYSILSDICKAKAALIMEEEDEIDMEEVNRWKLKSEQYKRLEKDALLKMETDELERDIQTDDDTVFSEHDDSKLKREREIDEVFDDPGFLEF